MGSDVYTYHRQVPSLTYNERLESSLFCCMYYQKLNSMCNLYPRDVECAKHPLIGVNKTKASVYPNASMKFVINLLNYPLNDPRLCSCHLLESLSPLEIL